MSLVKSQARLATPMKSVIRFQSGDLSVFSPFFGSGNSPVSVWKQSGFGLGYFPFSVWVNWLCINITATQTENGLKTDYLRTTYPVLEQNPRLKPRLDPETQTGSRKTQTVSRKTQTEPRNPD